MMGAPPEPFWRLILACFAEEGFALRILRRRLGLSTQTVTEDRRILEQVILPSYQRRNDMQRVLFVGCADYTAGYTQRYFAAVDYWTIEPDPSMSRYGSAQHVVAPLEQLAEHFPAEHFDLIVCNGVYGWGLNARAQCEAAFGQCYNCLRSGGELLIGWDDVPTHQGEVPLSQLESLRRFEQLSFGPLGGWQYLTHTPYRHTYQFYRKPPQ